ncbi:FecR family protein [Olivibacter sitiensis]|uniref:FecR family protein n=1 Tax=Olivibacter sitiensis TaxID=376470 RepID=UPI0003FE694E|nr:FecR family protein [Olivibacter sitiensis]
MENGVVGRLKFLLECYLSDNLSGLEEEELANYLDDPSLEELVRQALGEAFLAEKAFRLPHERRNHIIQQVVGRKSSVYLWRYIAAAAIIFLALGIGIYLYVADGNSGGTGVMHYAAADILPGGNRATLTLADGRTVELSEAQSGIVVGDGDIRYTDGTSLALSPTGGDRGRLDGSMVLELHTPKGGTYQVTLPDGSRVWLNADSKLRYPSRFDGKERIVELEGEAYFDVSHRLPAVGNRQTRTTPFIVNTRGQQVQVLGTEFNISAYADEEDTKTTLVSGAVKVSQLTTGNPQLLKPGQQSIISEAGIQVKTVDVAAATAWKEGKFSFEGKSFGQVMKELARWYDLELVYEGAVPRETFFGDAYRNTNLSIVLGALKSADIGYRLEKGKKLIITGKKGGTP